MASAAIMSRFKPPRQDLAGWRELNVLSQLRLADALRFESMGPTVPARLAPVPEWICEGKFDHYHHQAQQLSVLHQYIFK